MEHVSCVRSNQHGHVFTGFSQTRRPVYKLLTGLWILFGLAWLATLITLLQEAFTNVMDKAEQSVKKKKVELQDKYVIAMRSIYLTCCITMTSFVIEY